MNDEDVPDKSLKMSLEEMLRTMAKKMMPLVRKGPGTMFRLTFTKDEAKAEFFMGEDLVLQFTFSEDDENGKTVPTGKN